WAEKNLEREDSNGRSSLHATQISALPFRHHVDRPALLFQFRADAVLRRDRAGSPQRRDSETRSARALVVPMGCNGNRDFRSALPADVVGDAAELRDDAVD